MNCGVCELCWSCGCELWKMWTMSFVKYVYDICFMFELYVQLMYVWEDEEKIDTQVCRASANGATA